MGLSFKISKNGSRFRPKPALVDPTTINEASAAAAAEISAESSRVIVKNESHASTTASSSAHKLDVRDGDTAGLSSSSLSSGRQTISSEAKVSFVLNLYMDGFSITKPVENENDNHVLLQDDGKLLHPYDRNSESFLSAIESGHLPGDLLDDIACNFVDGGLICEVRDYRMCTPESNLGVSSMDGSPITTKLHLKMSLQNVVKDIPLIADDSWTYGDLMEVESRILKVLQPKLVLDPTPRLDRLSDGQSFSKINLGLSAMRKRRLKQLPEVVVTTTGKIHGKRICMDRVPETSGYKLGELGPVSGDMMLHRVHDNTPEQSIGPSNMLTSRSRSFVQDVAVSNLASQQTKLHVGVGAGNQRAIDDHMASVVSASVPSPSVQDVMSYNDSLNSMGILHGKMETQDGQLPSLSTINKRARMGVDVVQQQQFESYMDSLQGSDSPWRNPPLQQQANARGIQYVNAGGQKYSQLGSQDIAASVAMGQMGMRTIANNEHIGTEKLDNSEVGRGKNDMQMMIESEGMDPRLQQRIPHNSFIRPGYTTSWNNLSQQIEKDPRKDDSSQKRKSVQSPWVSAGNLAQSPSSVKSAELPGVSLGNHYAAVSSAAPPVLSQREKSGVTSISSVPRTQSMTGSANDSNQQQHQVQVAGKRRSNSVPKTPGMSGVGSPASVSNVSVPMNAASPSVGTPQLADHMLLDKFSKIETITRRLQLNQKKNKVDKSFRKPLSFSAQHVVACLSNQNIEEDNAKSLSKSLVGGSVNSHKIRVLNFVQADHTLQGSAIPVTATVRSRMIMSERPIDGMIAMYHGDVEDGDYLRAEDYLPTLPNSHFADLLAAQFQALMCRDGYYVEYDLVQTRPQSIPSSSQPSASANPSNNVAVDMQQYSEALSGSQPSEVANPTMSGNPTVNSSMNLPPNSVMLPPGNQQALKISQGMLPSVSVPARTQQLDPQQHLQQQQQQQLPPQNQQSLVQQPSQMPRSPLMMPPSSLSQLNAFGQNPSLQIGNQMLGKPPVQMLQQQSHIQQSQMPRKMVMGGLGTPVGVGGLGSGMVGLGGLGSVMGIGTGRGMGGTGISAPAGPIPGMSNLGQNTFSIGQAIRSGTLSPAHAQAAMLASRMKMANRGMLGGPQSIIAGMPGIRQMQPGSPGLSMLGPALNRGNIGPMQRTAMGAMGTKLMTGAGMNVHMSQQQLQQQQQQLLLQQQQQQQQQLQQQQQQMQQQETSPLQAAVSPPQVSSPSTMGIPQSLNQSLPQQASPQISSGTVHPMSGGNPEAVPASPQLSSQTLGSVGSITNSPLDLQGVNKSNSMSNS